MAVTGWINASNPYVTFRNVDGTKNITDSSFELADMGRNFGSSEMAIDIDDALINYGTISSVTISYKCYGKQTLSTTKKAYVRNGYLTNNSSGSFSWQVTHEEAVGRGSSNKTSISDTIVVQRASDDNKYHLAIGARNPITTLTNTVYCSEVSIYIVYDPKKYTLTVQPNNTSYGSVTGGGSYENGSSATLTATPNTGYKFVKWNDGNTSATRTVTVSSDATYTATFEPITYYIAFDSNGGSSIYDDRVIELQYNNSLILGSYGFIAPTVTFTYEHNGGTCTKGSTTNDRPLIGWEDLGNIKAPDGTLYTSDTFDAPFYANTYADLYAAFGYDKYALLSHYHNNGKAEGRLCVNTNGTRGVYPEDASISTLTNIDGETVTLRCQWGSLRATLPNITKAGCEFLGWSDGTNIYQIGDEVESTEDITFVALWKSNDNRIVISDTTQVDCLGVYVQPSSQSIIFKTENTGYWLDGEGADSIDGWHIKVRYSSDPIFSEPGVYEVSEIYINGERRW